MKKHTPGPWTVETVKTSIGICHRIMPFRGCVYDDHKNIGEETENLANAHLISAAPDLLECAKIALGLFTTYCLQDMELDVLEKELEPEVFARVKERYFLIIAAIAKAEMKP